MDTTIQKASENVSERLVALKTDPAVTKGAEAVRAIMAAPIVVRSDEEYAAAGDQLNAARGLVKCVTEGMTETFRPFKTFEKMVRDHFDTAHIADAKKAVQKVSDAMLAWDAEKSRIAREAREAEEQLVRDEQARIDARAAAAEAEAKRLREEADSVAMTGDADMAIGLQREADRVAAAAAVDKATTVYADPTLEATKTVRGATSTSSKRGTLTAELDNREEAMKHWPAAFTFEATAAARLYKEVGKTPIDDEVGVILGGVRFYMKPSIANRSR